MDAFTREGSLTIKKMGLVANFMPMEIFTLENIPRIKSMGKGHFIGSAYVPPPAPSSQASVSSSTMDLGGADFPTEKGSTQNQMVINLLFRRFIFRGIQERVEAWRRG